MWKNMKTAPRDGTEIILLIDGVVISGKWDANDEEWEVGCLDSHGCGCCASSNPAPTGWLCMPAPEVEN